MDTNTDQTQILMHLHAQAIQRFHARRQVEWQFSFTFWVLLGALAVATADLDPAPAVLGTGLLGVGATYFHYKLQGVYVHRQMKRDWALGIQIDSYLRGQLDDEALEAAPILKPGGSSHHGYSQFWSHWWQVLITGIVALVAFLLAVIPEL